MFEKEAEKKITEQFGTSGEYVTRQRIWQDGAEFGYNKANEWHDLRKNPDDLPEDTYDVLDQAGYKVHYNFFQNVWVNEKDEIDEHVIAWCEIPKFEE